jgi:hypothetical protein
VGTDRALDEEGIPDLEGPLQDKAKTGDPQEGAPPPSDRPASLDYGTTREEDGRPEPLDVRIARERSDRIVDEQRRGMVIVEPEDEDVGIDDDEKDLVGRDAAEDLVGLSAEEAAMHEQREPE